MGAVVSRSSVTFGKPDKMHGESLVFTSTTMFNPVPRAERLALPAGKMDFDAQGPGVDVEAGGDDADDPGFAVLDESDVQPLTKISAAVTLITARCLDHGTVHRTVGACPSRQRENHPVRDADLAARVRTVRTPCARCV